MRRRSITKKVAEPYFAFTIKSSNPLKSPTNEDRLAIRNFPNFSLFAVFDGHMGPTIANYSANNFLKFLGNYIISHGPTPQTIANAFLLFDKKLLKLFPHSGDGCTATVVYVDPIKILTANIGDSHAVLLRNPNNRTATKYLTVEHSWENPTERKRIQDAGGKFEDGYYTVGTNMIQPTRGFGDFIFKRVKDPNGQDLYSAHPSITTTPLGPSDLVLLVCTDGIGDTPHLALSGAYRNIRSTNPKELTNAIVTNPQLFGGQNSEIYYPDDLTLIAVDLQKLRKRLREMSQP